MIEQTSLAAYQSIIPELGARQELVLAVFRRGGIYSDQDVARILAMPINQITPRRNELEAKGLIRHVAILTSKFSSRKVKGYAATGDRIPWQP